MTGTTLTDDLPDGITALAVEPVDLCELDVDGRKLTCQLGTLAPAASVVITITAVATKPVTATNTAVVTVTNPGVPPVEDDARVTVTVRARMLCSTTVVLITHHAAAAALQRYM